jgi:hypothetical protein
MDACHRLPLAAPPSTPACRSQCSAGFGEGGQVDQPGRGRLEAAGAVVERREVFLEVDVEPFASCRFGVRCGPAGELCGYPLPLIPARDLRIEEESVVTAVPRDVDETDQGPIAQPGRDPAQAVGLDLVPPSGYGTPAV